MRVAAVSYAVAPNRTPLEFYRRLRKVVQTAKARSADLIVLPELIVLDLLGPDLPLPSKVIPRHLEERAEQYVGLLESLAAEFDIAIVGGSHIEANQNVCAFVSPQGTIRIGKQVLTRWEADEWGLDPSPATAPLPPVAVAICYDSEFPELIRPMALAGATVLCVPSYTETRHGFQRVRWSCHARAIENQIFVVHTALLGSLGREPVPSTYGSSAIIAPSTPPFPDNAILAYTRLNQPGIACADLDIETLKRSRDSGDTRNWNDYQILSRSTR